MEKILSQVYYNPSSLACYHGKEEVYKAAEALYQKIAREKNGNMAWQKDSPIVLCISQYAANQSSIC